MSSAPENLIMSGSLSTGELPLLQAVVDMIGNRKGIDWCLLPCRYKEAFETYRKGLEEAKNKYKEEERETLLVKYRCASPLYLYAPLLRVFVLFGPFLTSLLAIRRGVLDWIDSPTVSNTAATTNRVALRLTWTFMTPVGVRVGSIRSRTTTATSVAAMARTSTSGSTEIASTFRGSMSTGTTRLGRSASRPWAAQG